VQLTQRRSLIWGRSRIFGYGTDGLIAVVTFLLGILLSSLEPERNLKATTFSLVVSVIGCCALVVRRRWQLAVLVFLLGCETLVLVLAAEVRESPPLTLAIGVALFSVAVYRSREAAWISAACTAVVLMPEAALRQDQAVVQVLAGLGTWMVAATAVGDSVRNRRAYVIAVEERALRAEQSREREARRRVVEERLRIARELHDVVAHHITLIKVQAAVASQVLHQHPDQADEALGHIRRSSRIVLEEMGALVNVLRDDSEPASTQPASGLAHLPKLISGFEASGLPVTYVSAGSPRELPALADLAAYRIVQESLTNAYKHGRGGPATVEVGYRPRELRLRIHNPVPAGGTAAARVGSGSVTLGNRPSLRGRPGDGGPQLTRAGHGILGMRERAVAAGGHLLAEPDRDGGFAVVASLPLPPRRPTERERAERQAPGAASSGPVATDGPVEMIGLAGSDLRHEAQDR
jgi:signal transduction histidine kinase